MGLTHGNGHQIHLDTRAESLTTPSRSLLPHTRMHKHTQPPRNGLS